MTKIIRLIAAATLLAAPALAAEEEAPPAAPAPAPAPAASVPRPAAIAKERLEAILAPVALYPDAVLAQLLIASAYPDEVAAASAWLKDPRNASLRGAPIGTEIEAQQWDPSVKSLVPFPDLVAAMASHPDWLKQLGQAVAYQESDVLAAIQRLRHEARAAHRLDSSPELLVRDQGAVIAISPADPETLYLPVYDPAVAYGRWPYAGTPPVALAVAIGPTAPGFSVGYGIVPDLWGWAHTGWAAGTIALNVAAWNRINKIGPAWQGDAVWHREAHDIAYWRSGITFHDEPDRETASAKGRAGKSAAHADKGAKGHPRPGIHAAKAAHPAHPHHAAKPHRAN